MWSVASTTALWTSFAADTGTVLGLVLVTVLAVAAGLMGLGFALRKTQKHVTGKKF